MHNHPAMEPDQTITMFGDTLTLKAGGAQTNGAYDLLTFTSEPGAGPPLHIHHQHEEAFLVIEGHLTLRAGDESISAGPGSFVLVPRGTPHTYRVASSTPARYLALLSPGGMSGFFQEVHEATANLLDPDSRTPPPQAIETIVSIAQKYGLEIVGPPLES